MINTNNKISYNPAFQAIHIASTKNYVNKIGTTIDVFELSSKKDKDFLKNLCKKIKMLELMPNKFFDQEYKRWQEMLQIAVDNSLMSNKKTYLAVTDNKPCGIAVFLPGKNTFHLDCICTWPVKEGEKVKLAGKTLFKQIFQTFQKTKANKITLDAITNGPFDVVSKYEQLGFKVIGGANHKFYMETKASNIKENFKHLEQLIKTQEIDDGKQVNLNESLSF